MGTSVTACVCRYDPVAYRMEPLVSGGKNAWPPQLVPFTHGGWKLKTSTAAVSEKMSRTLGTVRHALTFRRSRQEHGIPAVRPYSSPECSACRNLPYGPFSCALANLNLCCLASVAGACAIAGIIVMHLVVLGSARTETCAIVM